jgi:hypothetical protein
MNVKELIERLQKMPQDAEVCLGFQETGHGKEGFMLFEITPEDFNYHESVWSFGNASPRPPSEQKHVVIFER